MIKGIYAATLSILNSDLGLDIKKTISHAEKVIDDGCHGVVFFGSTGQSQLISLSEKINLINNLPTSVQREKFIIGTGLNSLGDTVSIMKISKSLGFNNFLIMPPAYYKYEDSDVFNFYAQIIKQIPDSKILLYNFEKLSGYKFSEDIIYKFEKIKIDNFSMMPGSESKLLKGLELGCSGIITATTNATSKLARKVFDDFLEKNEQTENQKLCDVRSTFENYNLISGLHTFFGRKDQNYKNLLPPLKILTDNEEEKLFNDLENLNFK